MIVYLANRFLLVPQTEKIRSLETEIAELDNQITDMQNMIKKEDTIKKEWEMLHRERDEILKNYFPVLDQAQILYLLNDLISDEMVTISELSFSTPEEETIGEMPVKNMSISVPYRGTYDGTIEVVKALSSSPRRIVVDNLLMERGSDSEITGNMSLKIYSLEGIADTDEVIELRPWKGSEGSLFALRGYVNRRQQSLIDERLRQGLPIQTLKSETTASYRQMKTSSDASLPLLSQ